MLSWAERRSIGKQMRTAEKRKKRHGSPARTPNPSLNEVSTSATTSISEWETTQREREIASLRAFSSEELQEFIDHFRSLRDRLGEDSSEEKRHIIRQLTLAEEELETRNLQNTPGEEPVIVTGTPSLPATPEPTTPAPESPVSNIVQPFSSLDRYRDVITKGVSRDDIHNLMENNITELTETHPEKTSIFFEQHLKMANTFKDTLRNPDTDLPTKSLVRNLVNLQNNLLKHIASFCNAVADEHTPSLVKHTTNYLTLLQGFLRSIVVHNDYDAIFTTLNDSDIGENDDTIINSIKMQVTDFKTKGSTARKNYLTKYEATSDFFFGMFVDRMNHLPEHLQPVYAQFYSMNSTDSEAFVRDIGRSFMKLLVPRMMQKYQLNLTPEDKARCQTIWTEIMVSEREMLAAEETFFTLSNQYFGLWKSGAQRQLSSIDLQFELEEAIENFITKTNTFWNTYLSEEAETMREKAQTGVTAKSNMTWREGAAELSEVLANFRTTGTQIDLAGTDDSAPKQREIFRAVSSYYPSDWITMLNNQEQKVNVVSATDDERGSATGKTVTLPHNDPNSTAKTSFHESGHLFEDTNPSINMIQNHFFDRRTKGSTERALGWPYGDSKTMKHGNFILPYIGLVQNREVVSEGFSYAYMEPEKLWRDKEFAELIYGLLVLC